MEGITDKHQKQDELWRCIVQKQEGRLADLQTQLCAAGARNDVCSCATSLSNPPPSRHSCFSVTSEDLKNIVRVKDLVEHQKELTTKMAQKKAKEKEFMKELKKTTESVEEDGCACLVVEDENSPAAKNKILLQENRRLTDELTDLKIYMRACVERIEGPVYEQIKKERCRTKCMQRDVDILKESAASAQLEKDELNRQLAKALLEVDKLTKSNDQLKEKVCELCCKCNELQELFKKEKEKEKKGGFCFCSKE